MRGGDRLRGVVGSDRAWLVVRVRRRRVLGRVLSPVGSGEIRTLPAGHPARVVTMDSGSCQQDGHDAAKGTGHRNASLSFFSPRVRLTDLPVMGQIFHREAENRLFRRPREAKKTQF